jgi:hypothetical protein
MGSGNDSITLNAGASGNINGGDNTDSLVVGNSNQANNNLSLTSRGGGNLGNVIFSNIENINLGTGNDTATVSSNGVLTGNLSLGGGNNTLTLSGGSIEGNVIADSGDDFVDVQSGQIKGNVTLGEGNNIFRAGGQSALTGTVVSGNGNDGIILGSGSLPIGVNAQLATAIVNLKTTLYQAATDGSLNASANASLGSGASNNSNFQEIATRLQNNNFSDLPNISLVPGKDMDGALGAYVESGSEKTIVINKDWLATASSNDINAVLVEEVGHFLDKRVNGSVDTVGDEGEVFSKALLGYAVSGSNYPGDTNGTVTVYMPDGTKTIGEANHSSPVASSASDPSHLSIDGGGGFDSMSLPDFNLKHAADFARTGGFGEFVNYTSEPEGETLESSYLSMSIKNVEEVTWDKTSQVTAAVSDVSLMGVQDTTVSSGADLSTIYGVAAKSAANSTSVGDGVSSYSAGLSLGIEDSSFTAGDALTMSINFGGTSSSDAQSVADAANAVAVGYGVGIDHTDLIAGSSLDLVIKDASQVAADAFTTTGDVFAVASNDGIGATDLIAIGDSAVDAVFTLNLTTTASAITTDGIAEAVGWMAAAGLDNSAITSGGIGLINVSATGLNGVSAESITSGATADAFSAMVGVNNTSFDFADTNSTIASSLTNDTTASSSSIFGRAMSGLTSTVFGLFGGTTGGDTITNAQSVTSIISDNGFADAASVGGMASSIASHSATGISNYDITTTENLLLNSKNTVDSTASSSVVDA